MKKLILLSALIVHGLHCDNGKIERLICAGSHAEKTQIFSQDLVAAQKCFTNREVMDVALSNVIVDGMYLELGVFSGNSINYIAQMKPSIVIHGFDSFEELPENWVRGDTNNFKKGFFAVSDLPAVLSNVVLHKGWFENSLPIFKQDILRDQSIAFMHIDCDIYSSTKTIFDVLGNNIAEGTILLFDELYNYPGFENHELKALYEFLDQKQLSVQFLAYNVHHEQVAVKIISTMLVK